MQQTELTLHLLGTAPPMPPPPLLQSLLVPSRAASHSRLWPEGRSCTHHSNSMATLPPYIIKQASHARIAMHSENNIDVGHALGTGRLGLASFRLLQLRAGSAHRRKSRAHVRCCNMLTAICRRMMSTASERLSLENGALSAVEVDFLCWPFVRRSTFCEAGKTRKVDLRLKSRPPREKSTVPRRACHALRAQVAANPFPPVAPRSTAAQRSHVVCSVPFYHPLFSRARPAAALPHMCLVRVRSPRSRS